MASSTHIAFAIGFAVAIFPVAALADPACHLMSDAQYEATVLKSDDALGKLRDQVDQELWNSEILADSAVYRKLRPLQAATRHFLTEVSSTQIFKGYTAEVLAPAERTLGVQSHNRDRDAIQATYRARREVLALLAALPKDKKLEADVLAASTKTRQVAQLFIQVSTPLVAHDVCRFKLEQARREAERRKRENAPVPVECQFPGPLGPVVGAQCDDLINSAVGSSAICADNDQGGTCKAVIAAPPAKPESLPAWKDPSRQSGGICPNQPALAAGEQRSGRPDGYAVAGGEGAGGNSSSALPQ
jgi:hypothetical protein